MFFMPQGNTLYIYIYIYQRALGLLLPSAWPLPAMARPHSNFQAMPASPPAAHGTSNVAPSRGRVMGGWVDGGHHSTCLMYPFIRSSSRSVW